MKNISFNFATNIIMNLILLMITLMPVYTFSQTSLENSVIDFNKPEFTISYDVLVKARNIDGLAETYNGGIQTIFVKNDLVRIRLVSLMRTQSIFFFGSAKPNKPVAAVLKESGKDRTKMMLDEKEWQNFNKADSNIICDTSFSENLTILNLLCKKATIKQKKDKGYLEIYYVPGTRSAVLSRAIPLFSCIPGLVLKYTYTLGSKVIEYTASAYNENKMDPAIFILPSQGYQLKKYVRGNTKKKR